MSWSALEQALSAKLPGQWRCIKCQQAGGTDDRASEAGAPAGTLSAQGAQGNGCNAVLSVAGYNLRWPMH